MNNPFDDPDGTFLVLVNEEDQHSLWPGLIPVPSGWTQVHGPVGRKLADQFVTENWSDIRPRSLASKPPAELSADVP